MKNSLFTILLGTTIITQVEAQAGPTPAFYWPYEATGTNFNIGGTNYSTTNPFTDIISNSPAASQNYNYTTSNGWVGDRVVIEQPMSNHQLETTPWNMKYPVTISGEKEFSIEFLTSIGENTVSQHIISSINQLTISPSHIYFSVIYRDVTSPTDPTLKLYTTGPTYLNYEDIGVPFEDLKGDSPNHFVIVGNLNEGYCKLYINGNLIHTKTITSSISSDFYIEPGKEINVMNNSPNNPLDTPVIGAIWDELAFYTDALSDSDVSDHYNNITSGNNYFTESDPDPQLAYYWVYEPNNTSIQLGQETYQSIAPFTDIISGADAFSENGIYTTNTDWVGDHVLSNQNNNYNNLNTTPSKLEYPISVPNLKEFSTEFLLSMGENTNNFNFLSTLIKLNISTTRIMYSFIYKDVTSPTDPTLKLYTTGSARINFSSLGMTYDDFTGSSFNHFALVGNLNDKKRELYLNGNLIHSQSINATSDAIFYSSPIYETNVFYSTPSTYSITMGLKWDEFAFYYDALSPELVSSHYNDVINGRHYGEVVSSNGPTHNSVNAKSVDKSINIFPTPNNGTFNVNLSGFEKDAKITIYNSLGQRTENTISSVYGGIRINHQKALRPGIYLLNVQEKNASTVKKFIVQ